jgi:hypothetical protein
MQIKLAVPDINYIMDYMLGNYSNIDDQAVKIIFGNEQFALDALITNEADAAIITPREYGKALKLLDLRIMPYSFLTAWGFTGIATIVFEGVGDRLDKCFCPSVDSFIMNIGKLVLSEKYGLSVDFMNKVSNQPGSDNQIDLSMAWGLPADNPRTLDITEEWMDAFDVPLPLAFWVCKAEDYPENLPEIIKNIAGEFTHRIEIREQWVEGMKHDRREGEITTIFTPEIEIALEQTLQALFYHQVFNEIPGIKMFGKI